MNQTSALLFEWTVSLNKEAYTDIIKELDSLIIWPIAGVTKHLLCE